MLGDKDSFASANARERVLAQTETAIRRIETLLMSLYARAHEQGKIDESTLLHLGWMVDNIKDMPLDQLQVLLNEIIDKEEDE